MSIIRLHRNDNVAIVTTVLNPGDRIDEERNVIATAKIPPMHKVALKAIPKDGSIYRYNQVIGVASQPIKAGEHVHEHNCESLNVNSAHATQVMQSLGRTTPIAKDRCFNGYRRPCGRVGTRNYIGILTTVNCSATVAKHIESAFRHKDALVNYPNVDGVVAFTHPGGCSTQKGGIGYLNLRRVLSGFAQHPNFGALLIVGLGCEVMQLDGLMKEGGLAQSESLRRLDIQEMGGTAKTIELGIKAVEEMLPIADSFRRGKVSVSEITVALQCGGSDALSGVTANPALGCAVDTLVHYGGTAILAETPEIYGAEHLLTARAASEEVAQSLLRKIHWWADHVAKFGEKIENNPSPGNKAGGLTTIQEKSLGAASKGGSTTLNGVYDYGELVTEKGLVFMDSPGFDAASVTGQIASGATVVCFTTGRGSAFGSKPAPTVKLATNSPLYQRQLDDMDINCGQIIDGKETVESMGKKIFESILAVASGERTKSELLDYGDNEFAPWHIGPVL